MVSRLRIGPEGGPFVTIDEDGGSLDIDAPNGEIDFQTNKFLRAALHDVTAVSANATAETGEVVLADASGGAVTVTLPAPSNGATVTVKRTNSAGNAVTVATPASETIDGQADVTLGNQFDAVTIVSDGSEYFEI